MTELGFAPDWPAPANVGAFISCRNGGFSEGDFRSNNLGDHVGDAPEAVARNRQQLQGYLGLSQLCWLEQVHGSEIVSAEIYVPVPKADACIAIQPGRACVILTADCLPLLLCDRQGRQVAALHCGWRGLAQGLIARVLQYFHESGIAAEEILAYLGPAIGPQHYEVGDEVRAALAATVAPQTEFARPVAAKPGHSLLDLYSVARAQLAAAGVKQVFGGEHCSFAESDRFYSYRRDGVTGRMASLIWLRD